MSFLFALLILLSLCAEPPLHIRIHSGSIDRVNSIVSFSVPQTVTPGIYASKSASGESFAIQVDGASTGWVLVPLLKANSELHLTLNPALPAASGGTVQAKETPSTIVLSASGREILQFFHRENQPPDSLGPVYRRGGYIHPVRTPSGTVLTGHLNGPYHMHHSGIWSAWTNTEFQGRKPDFWNAQLLRGRVDIDSLLASWSGAVHAGFQSVNRFTDLTTGSPVTALLELWDVRAYAIPESAGMFVFDVTLTQTVSPGAALVLPEYLYGGVGFRGHPDWNDTLTTTILTSEGLGRLDGHATRARWAHFGGWSDGKLGGVAIMGHPTNFRFPQPMRIHPTMPFFNFAPTQLGEMSIQPGKPYVVRYRYVTYDGEPDAALIERMWTDFAFPPSVSVGR